MTEKIKYSKVFYDSQIGSTEVCNSVNEYLDARPEGQSALGALADVYPKLTGEVLAKAFTLEDEKNLLLSSIISTLEPWLCLPFSCTTELPTFTAISLARQTGLSPNTVLQLVRSGEIRVDVNGIIMKATTSLPSLPDKASIETEYEESNKVGRLVRRKKKEQVPIKYKLKANILIGNAGNETVVETKVSNVNKKRLISRSLKKQYTPNSTVVKRTRSDKAKMSRLLPILATEQARIAFEPITSEELIEVGKNIPETLVQSFEAQEQLSGYQTKDQYSKAIEVIFNEPNAESLIQVYSWFRDQGPQNNWILGNNELLFAEKLIRFNKGEPTDFLIWNCMGFYWTKAWQDRFPKVRIVENVSESIALYYANKLKEISAVLSPLSTPTFTVLLPSNEVFDQSYTDLRLYDQSTEERKAILEKTKYGINSEFKKRAPNLPIEVLAWDEYLAKIDAPKKQDEYTKQGRNKLVSSPNIRSIRSEMIRSAESRFKNIGITLDDETLLTIQEAYYSMYVGEGVAFPDQQGRNIININFEEMRVAQLEYLGAEGNIAILTPIKLAEMEAFYRWKNEQIRIRNEKLRKEK